MKSTPDTTRGFSLIEVMVALIIIAVGMLGIAKMQALALSTTESSGTRSLVAIQAASFAATMHTNRDYWVSGPPAAATHVNFATATAGSPAITIDTFPSTQNCASASACTASQVAAYDTWQWAAALAKVVPAAAVVIACPPGVTPVACTIQISYQENVTSTNNGTAAVSSAAGALDSAQYTLYVEP